MSFGPLLEEDVVNDERKGAYTTLLTDRVFAEMCLGFPLLTEQRPLPRGPYRSIWRVLHVDGFEQKKYLQFFGYTPVHYDWSMSASTQRRADVMDEHCA